MKYILHSNTQASVLYLQVDDLPYSIERELEGQSGVYETVIPDAGTNKAFALKLVDLLNNEPEKRGEVPIARIVREVTQSFEGLPTKKQAEFLADQIVASLVQNGIDVT